jgi:hypothetical protein
MQNIIRNRVGRNPLSPSHSKSIAITLKIAFYPFALSLSKGEQARSWFDKLTTNGLVMLSAHNNIR